MNTDNIKKELSRLSQEKADLLCRFYDDINSELKERGISKGTRISLSSVNESPIWFKDVVSDGYYILLHYNIAVRGCTSRVVKSVIITDTNDIVRESPQTSDNIEVVCQ